MKIYDTVMEIPVKKAAVLVVCTVLFLIFIVQTLFVNQVFSIINRNITHFDQLFKQDEIEHNKDLREFDEQQAYDAQMSAHNTDRLNLSILATPQEKGCFHEKNIKRFEAMKSLAYVQHSEPARSNIEFELNESREAIKVAIEKHEFDPALCKPVAL